MREDLTQQMRPPARQHAERRLVATDFVDGDEVDRLGGIELVDLETSIDDGHVPVEEVDELRLAVREHGLERRPVRARRIVVDREDHGLLPFDCAGKASSNRSEEHTSELQSLMRISYAVFCLKKKTNKYTS